MVQSRQEITSGLSVELTNISNNYDNFGGQLVITNSTDNQICMLEITINANFSLLSNWGYDIIDLGENSYTIKSKFDTGIFINIPPNSSYTLQISGSNVENPQIESFSVTELVVKNEPLNQNAEIPENPENPETPENPEIPDTPENPEILSELDVLVAFGIFNEEENAITLNWAYQDNTGNFSIYETTNEKTLLAEITDNTEYSFVVDNSTEKYTFVIEKYVSENENIISNEIVMQINENGEYEFVYVDRDEDKLPDIYEHILGTNLDIPDTDGDLLPDGYEVITLNTSPLLLDTDDNGIPDTEEDFDSDTLSNLQEYELETDPINPDTDFDKINDGEEISLGTNPLVPDSDADGLLDETEIELGFDPLNPDTDSNGIPDGEETTTQAIDLNLIGDTSVTPYVELTGKGDFTGKLSARDISANPAIADLPYIVGEPFDFIHDDELNFGIGKLTFTISDTLLSENNINDLAIAHYDYETGSVTLLETESVNDTTISAAVEHFSPFFVVNKKNLKEILDSITIEDIFYSEEQLLSEFDFGNNHYAVFKGPLTWLQAKETCEALGGHLATVTSAEENAAITANLKGNNCWLGATETNYKWSWVDGKGLWSRYDSPAPEYGYSNWNSGEPNNGTRGKGAEFHSQPFLQIYGSSGKWDDGGYWPNSTASEDNCGKQSFVCEWENGNPNVDRFSIMLSDYTTAVLNKYPSPDDYADTDRDGISDFNELIYPPIQRTIYMSNTSYTVEVWNYKSNPAKEDTDGDGLLDGKVKFDDELNINLPKDNELKIYNEWCGYNGETAIEYALKWYNRHNSDFQNFDGDFLSIEGILWGFNIVSSSDCANFVSQCLFEGGIEMTDEWYSFKRPLLAPYGVPYYEVSSAWMRVSDQLEYFNTEKYCEGTVEITNGTLNEVIASGEVEIGDLVYFANRSEDNYSHAAIVSQSNINKICYAAHSGSQQDKKFSEFFDQHETGKILVIKIKDMIIYD